MTTDATAVRQLLDLGAVTGEPADTSVPMVATQWSHPALPGRTVVRLTAEPLVRAEELSLEVTGFAPGPRTNVGHTRRRAIGFPAWPIIHDPANAHHALNIVADLERMARTARSKPGFAKDQVDDLVRILDATAPHFLPTLLEEAGRIFRRFDNPTYAAQMFAKARETERRHNLPIDPERHAEVFLEFAYAGALPVKELTAEATRLGQLTDPAQAYADFRTLSIERVRGGLEPYANMAKDLRKLAKAAGLDAATEDRRVAADLLQTPVINKAETHFWKAYDKAITQLTADDADIRARVLSLTPDAFGLDEWLERLEAWGALGRVIATNDVAFFRRMVTWLQTFGAWNRRGAPTPRLMELAEELAPALIASGEPVVLSRTRLAMVPADTLDKFAALGLPLALEGDKNGWTQINLRDWGDQAERGDLAHLAGLQEFAEAFAQGFDNAYSEHGAALSQAAGTRPMVLARIAQAVKDTAVRPLSLGTLARVWNSLLAPVAEVDEPEIRAGLAQVRDQIDGPQLLADNLRFGTLAELTWPEVEEAYAAEAAKLARQQRNQFYSFGPDVEMSWPELFLAGTLFGGADSPRALAAPTAKATLENAIVVGEEVALEWRDPDNRNLVWAWSRDPGTTYEKEWRYLSWDVRVPMHVSLVTDQGRLFASGLMRPGEDGWLTAEDGTVLHDGQDYWAATTTEVLELDPATGRTGRASLPDWFAELAARFPDHRIRSGSCQLHPVTPQTADSLLSTADGFHRSAVLETLEEESRTALVVAADGTVTELDDLGQHSVAVPLSRPGGGTWLMIGNGGNIIDADSRQPLLPAWENPVALPPSELPVLAWHHARVRDEEASRWLRQVTVEQADALLESLPVVTHATPNDGSDDGGVDDDMIAAWMTAATPLLPAQIPPGPLAEAVIWMTLTTAVYLDKLENEAEEDAEEPLDETLIQDHTLLLISGTADRWSIPTLAEVLLAGRLLGLSETGPTSVEHDWRHRMQFGSYIGREAALLMLAATPGNSPEAVRACQAYWQAFRTAGLLDADLDVATVGFPEELEKLNKQGRRQVTDGVAIVENSRTLAVSARGPIRDIEINGHRLIIAEQLPPVGTRVDLDPFFDALAEAVAETPRAYQPEWGVRLAELTGMPLVDAHLLAAGLPGFGDSENNFLPKDLRTAMKLKVTEANQARDRLQKHGDLLPRLLAVAVPVNDPARLLTDGPDIDAMAELWKAEVGSGPALPTEVVTAKPNWVSDEVLTQLISGNSSEFWRTDPSWDHTLAEAALWLAWELPADSPLRTELSQALSHARDAFHSLPRLRQLGHDSLGVSRRLLGLPPRPEQGEKDILVVRAFRVNGVEYWSELVTILPTDLTGPDDPDVAIARAICDELRSGDDILWLLTDQINPFIEGVLPIDRPGVVQDPRVTVPTLVAEVAAEHGVSEEAAAYYLQLLALARPTDRNVQAWNGWTRAQRVAAGAELVAKDLVVEGKRARAGRTLFLPGGWLEMSAPNLPMETWKTPWHAVRVMESGRGQQRLEGTPALLPPAELFAAAWARSRGDDGPGFGELQTTRKGIR